MTNLDLIRTHITDELIPDRHERGKYQCPICGSGTNLNKRSHGGAFSIDHDGIHGHCFSCGFYGDIFDLEIAKNGGDPQKATRDEKAAATKAVVARYSGAAGSAPAAQPVRKAAEPTPAPHDFSAELDAWHSSLKGSDGEKYLRHRGFTPETMARFNLGYDPVKRRITIPYNRSGTYYSARAIDDPPKDGRNKYDNPPGHAPLFNAAALQRQEACFVVEGPLCAISIIQELGSAIALGGTAGPNKLLNLIDKQRPTAPLILCLDNDKENNQGHRPGQETQAKLAEELTRRGIFFIEENIAGDCKDPNELLQKDATLLRRNVSAATLKAEQLYAQVQQEELTAYEGQTAAATFADFEKYLADTAQLPPVSTGFKELDKVLNGGLTPGLYIMGAVSSLGKTSWMLNIADNISAAGRDVLYFSLEMSRNELIAKSISRLSFAIVGETHGNIGEALSTFGVIHSGKSTGDKRVLHEAMRRYRETIGKHMWIFEGVGVFGMEQITRTVEDHIRITGRKPVVFIDYLQIIAPADARSTDKQNTDRTVVELKRLSASHDIPIFSISSLNRQSYTEPITMAAFKESGAIEYGSDVLIGLQPYGMGYEAGESTQRHTKRVRELMIKTERSPQIQIEVRVLKNRNGGRGDSVMTFDKIYNSFFEVPAGFKPVYTDLPEELGEEDDETFSL